MVGVVLAIVGPVGVGVAAAPVLRFAPVAHRDGRDVDGGSLDLTSVTFGQQDTQLVLKLRTASPWNAADLAAFGGRDLCLVLSYAPSTVERARICVVSEHGVVGLDLTLLDAGGAVTAQRPLTASVSRPDQRTLSASFTPLAADLPLGPFAWRVQSDWTDHAACADPLRCTDVVPNAIQVNDAISILAQPPCFGAASRDPLHACHNPALNHAVVPTPANAVITPNAYCDPSGRVDLVSVCAFGATASQATSTIALVGDSHAAHWRGALEVVAQARRWHGVSMTRASCPFTQAAPVLVTAGLTGQCARWNTELRAWFFKHPDVSTVVTSADSATLFSGSSAAGYQAAWRGLPASVKRIVVIRDTPRIVSPQAGCVQHAIAVHQPAGVRCAQTRAADLTPDPQVSAVAAMHDPRVALVDLSHYMCDARLCFAVVGGALVRKDGTHLTRVFATSLGPYLLRAIGRVVP